MIENSILRMLTGCLTHDLLSHSRHFHLLRQHEHKRCFLENHVSLVNYTKNMKLKYLIQKTAVNHILFSKGYVSLIRTTRCKNCVTVHFQISPLWRSDSKTCIFGSQKPFYCGEKCKIDKTRFFTHVSVGQATPVFDR